MFEWAEFKNRLRYRLTGEAHGFKAMRPNMTCRDFQFGIDKFHHDGPVIPCESGFHFCWDIEDLQRYYSHRCRIFRVKGSGTVVFDYNKMVCSDIEIIEEIDYNDLHWRLDSCDWVKSVCRYNRSLAEQKKMAGIDILI